MFTAHSHARIRKHIVLILAIILLLTSFLSLARVPDTDAQHHGALWEYNVVTILHANTEQRKSILNEQGRAGWELISSEDDKTGTGETTFTSNARADITRRH
jgi:hypothetical protein